MWPRKDVNLVCWIWLVHYSNQEVIACSLKLTHIKTQHTSAFKVVHSYTPRQKEWKLSDAEQSGRLRSDRNHGCQFACLVKKLPIYVAFSQVIALLLQRGEKKNAATCADWSFNCGLLTCRRFPLAAETGCFHSACCLSVLQELSTKYSLQGCFIFRFFFYTYFLVSDQEK